MTEIDNYRENDFIPNIKEDCCISHSEIDECPICLDEMTTDVHTTCCGHKFHGKCLNSSITKCPLCRSKLNLTVNTPSSTINKLENYMIQRILSGMGGLAYTN